jgi:hypothetical protein
MSTGDTVRRIEDLPCWQCADPCADDLRHALAQTGGVVNEAQCSPTTGLPIRCYRIRSTPIPLQQVR